MAPVVAGATEPPAGRNDHRPAFDPTMKRGPKNKRAPSQSMVLPPGVRIPHVHVLRLCNPAEPYFNRGCVRASFLIRLRQRVEKLTPLS